MKKFLLFLFALLTGTLAAVADSAVFDFTKPTELSPSVTPAEEAGNGVDVSDQVFTSNGVTFVATKGTSVVARIWTGSANTGYANDLRVYGGATMTVTAPDGVNITSIAFTGSKVSDFTPDNGEYANKTWTGEANSVVFSVTGALYIETITVTFGEGTTPDPVEPSDKTTLFEEAFNASSGDFTIEDKTIDPALSYIWTGYTSGSTSCMKASSYKGQAYAGESWLISPTLDFTQASELSLEFGQAANYFSNQENVVAAVSVKAKAEDDTEWTNLTVSEWPTGTSWTFITSTADLSAFDGKKVQIAFVYTSTADLAGTWEINNLKIEGKGEVVVPEPEVPNYTSIADLISAATSTRTDATFEFSDLLVTGVGLRGTNYSVYVTDGTNSTLFYGSNEPAAKKGDKISGKLAGQLCLYNGAAQFASADYTNVTVTSSDNPVEAKVVTIADLGNDTKQAYQNQYVQLQGVYFTSDALASSNITMVDDSDNEITLRDNFNVLADVIFSTDKPYNVSGYVAYYNGNAQLYAGSADDVQIVTNLKDAATAWASDEVVVLPNDPRTVNNGFTTESDGTRTFTSDNEAVATVDAEGNVTVTGYGVATITAETAETSEYLAGKASFTLYAIEGEGTIEKPYSVSDVQYYNGKTTEKVWVKGNIAGFMDSKSTLQTTAEGAQASNIALGSEELYVPVQLPSKSEVRTALNLLDNPDLLNTTVWVYGTLETYFQMPGVKNTSDYSLDGTTGIIAVVDDNTGRLEIYSLDGRRLDAPVKGINIINGKKVLVK